MIDLHVHSTASDGTFTPAQLVALAEKSGVCAFALTDHDSTDGIEEALDAAEKRHGGPEKAVCSGAQGGL